LLLTAINDFMEDLLLRFVRLFTEPTSLPHVRPRSHQIQLMPRISPVMVQPYRYAHAQKAELETQCRELLHQGVIRPSSSAFLVSVILVRKTDGSWRMCMDYRTLNSKTIKDKYPIPVVEELLNELWGVVFFTKLDLHSGS
jgi:hypothetical protein